MATITARLTVEQFLQLPEEQTLRCELVEGEIVPMDNAGRVGNAGRGHELVKANFIDHLVTYNRQHRMGKVFSETMYAIRSSEARTPDVSSLLARRLTPGVAYPKHRTLWTHHADGSRVLKEDQYLEEPGLLPGFRVLVSNFFEGI